MNEPFAYGDRVLLLDSKQRRYMMILKEEGEFHSHNGFVPHADIVRFAKSGHLPTMENPKAVADAVRNWLAR